MRSRARLRVGQRSRPEAVVAAASGDLTDDEELSEDEEFAQLMELAREPLELDEDDADA
jgi:hypothetical protein